MLVIWGQVVVYGIMWDFGVMVVQRILGRIIVYRRDWFGYEGDQSMIQGFKLFIFFSL